MRVFQIEAEICYWDATSQFPTVESTVGYFPPDLLFVEAPDYVREGWGYVNNEFIEPTPPEGYLYDRETGSFYLEGFEPSLNNDALYVDPIDSLLDALIE